MKPINEPTTGLSAYLHGKDPASAPGTDGSYPLLCHLLDTAIVANHVWQTRVRAGLKERLASSLGVEIAAAGRAAMLVAALHDVGKLNPFFQYQERFPSNDFAADLAATVGLPPTPRRVREHLIANPTHPLRRHEFISHRAISGKWAADDDDIRETCWIGTITGGHHGYWRSASVAQNWVGAPGAEADQLVGDQWAKQQNSLVTLVESAIDVSMADIPHLTGPHGAVPFVCFSGLLTLCDWIASDDSVVRAGKALWAAKSFTADDPYHSVEASRAWIAARSDELSKHVENCLGPLAHPTKNSMRKAILGDFAPRPLQQEATDDTVGEAGLWIAMYPTGDGKSEAALLRSAHRPDEGFFFGLPTLATTDAMESRLQTIAMRFDRTESLPLLKSHQFAGLLRSTDVPKGHGSSDDDACEHSNPTWYTASIRKLVSPNVVGTVDQALVGALAQRHITLRLFGLANHHVILDEVHTYDEYQTQLLIELLYWWGATHTRVTLLSATLATTHLRSMVQAYRAGLAGERFDSLAPKVAELAPPFPSTVTVPLCDDKPTVVAKPVQPVQAPPDTLFEHVCVKGDRIDRVADHVEWAVHIAAAHPTSPIAIVSNVVSDCQQIAAALQRSSVTKTHEVLCLHSSLVGPHRQAAEERLLARVGRQAHETGFGPSDKPLLVVGTQVIQASLDFDVDFLSTDLAPAPDLLQRLGRMWRFHSSTGPVHRGGRLDPSLPRTMRIVSVVGEDDFPTRKGSVPYLHAVMRRTHQHLASLTGSPQNVLEISQAWVDHAYDKDPWSLLSEIEDEVAAASAEEVDQAAKRKAAASAHAKISPRNEDRALSLFTAKPESHRRQSRTGTRWRDLVHMTATPDYEEVMRTRFIEQETLVVLIYDSSRVLSFEVAGHQATLPALEPERLIHIGPGAAATTLMAHRLAVPSHLARLVEPAIEQTLSGTSWRPEAKLLQQVRPLDLAHLATQIAYHPTVGLIQKEEDSDV